MRKPEFRELLLAMFCLFLMSPSVVSQNNANIWYFGEYAGIDFNSGSPVALTNSAMNQGEGCATISNNNGNLLFYTDGMRIWNANHTIMPNGTGLMGHRSSAQSGIIVPKPGNPDIYFVFTVPSEIGTDGLRYSEVDMTLQGGLGDVNAVKNVFLVSPTEEKVTAVRHANNTDIWVVTHTWNSNDFHAYLVTASGVSATAVISSIGTVHSGIEGWTNSCMKFSPDGTRLAIVTRHNDSFEIFDFDASNGTVSNPVTFAQSYPTGYGIEFSQDGSSNQQLMAANYGMYWVDTYKDGCAQSDTIIISEECLSSLWLPNVFTPNSDGKNDRFLSVYENIIRYQIYIYNRWGQLIYESKDIDEGWDGKFKGQMCSNGVYFFIANYYDTFYGDYRELTGSNTLLR